MIAQYLTIRVDLSIVAPIATRRVVGDLLLQSLHVLDKHLLSRYDISKN